MIFLRLPKIISLKLQMILFLRLKKTVFRKKLECWFLIWRKMNLKQKKGWKKLKLKKRQKSPKQQKPTLRKRLQRRRLSFRNRMWRTRSSQNMTRHSMKTKLMLQTITISWYQNMWSPWYLWSLLLCWVAYAGLPLFTAECRLDKSRWRCSWRQSNLSRNQNLSQR